MLQLFSKAMLRFVVVLLIVSQANFAQTQARAKVLPANPAAKSAEAPATSPLVTDAWLAKHLKDADLIVLDASSPPKYNKAHIVGAQNVQIYELISYGFGGRSPQQTEELFQSLGLSNGKKVVVYDEGGTNVATTLFFALYRNGYPASDLLYLDGGLTKWQADGNAVTTEVTAKPKPGTFKVKTIDARAELPEVLSATGDREHYAVIEALTPDWHYGQTTMLVKGGHIPNSVLAPDVDFFNADKTFKSAEEIKQMLAFLHVRPEQQIYTYCGGGVAATVPYFAAKFIAGYPKVKVFQESEMGWFADSRDLPFWTYDAPYMMRDATFMQLWNGPMLRNFLAPRVSVVDVRSVEAYKEGHIAFSVNIPPDAFRQNVSFPEKLAQSLGADGVSPAHEAVIVSGAGLTKEAALAYVILERLGQNKVSMLMDGVDSWAKEGLLVTQAPTIIGAKKGPKDFAIAPQTYTIAPRKEVLIADPQSTKGIYPKLFLASGKDLLAKSPEGKVVHVPYTDLLNADGFPKAAKDIWAVLTKGGVSRYAEIICVSDDPGEAAANYYILKLMGFSDVKVLGS